MPGEGLIFLGPASSQHYNSGEVHREKKERISLYHS